MKPWSWLVKRSAILVFPGLLACLFVSSSGCATTPIITREIYQDRSIWVRLEENPYALTSETSVGQNERQQVTAPRLATWMKGFRVLTERGIIGMAVGKEAMVPAFVEKEIMALTPHLAKALAMASSKERVAYCFAVDRNASERHITTASLWVQPPYLYYKLDEYRTLVQVPSLATSTSEACMTKPQPGYKTADRYFRLEYEPEDFVVGYGTVEKFAFMAGIVANRRGEVVFKLSTLIPNQGVPAPSAVPSLQEVPVKSKQAAQLSHPSSNQESARPAPILPAAGSFNPAQPTSRDKAVPSKYQNKLKESRRDKSEPPPSSNER